MTQKVNLGCFALLTVRTTASRMTTVHLSRGAIGFRKKNRVKQNKTKQNKNPPVEVKSRKLDTALDSCVGLLQTLTLSVG